jgi:peroxiredoxin
MTDYRWMARLTLAAALTIVAGSISVLAARTMDLRGRNPFLQVGDLAPALDLRDATGTTRITTDSLRGKMTVVFFGSGLCPVTSDYSARIRRLAEQFRGEIQVIEIDSDQGQASPVPGATDPRSRGLQQDFPVLLDPTGAVGRAYYARVTPTFYVIDPQGRLRYSGAFDDDRNPARAHRHYVEDSIRALRKGMPVDISSTQAFGCSIKQQPK